MLKIMIVDDEIIIRTGLATVINWNELGLILLEPAASAEEAISRIPTDQPHILLTDIRMTGKSGLELAEEARELIPELDIIILTGFDDFKYTQKAIQQRINDYLLKTSRPDDIIRTVLRAKQRVEERYHIHTQDLIKLKKQLLEKVIIYGESIDEHIGAELHKVFSPLHHHDSIAGYQLWILNGEGWADSIKGEKLLAFAIENVCMELLKCEAFIYQSKVVAILPVYDGVNHVESRKTTIQKIEVMLRCRIRVTVGKLASYLTLHDSYLSAQQLIPYLFLIREPVIYYDDILLRTGVPTSCTPTEQAQLTTILLDDDSIKLKQWIDGYIDKHLAHAQLTLDSLEAAMQFIVTVSNQWLDWALKAIHTTIQYPNSLPFRYIREIEPANCLFQYVHTIMKHYHHVVQELSLSHVQKAKSYVESQLELDISLQQVASHVHIHPNHLSELFKKETGITFSDYLTKQRMKRAIQLLSATKMKVSDIATNVGYTDVKYFSQLFKRDTGVTPSEYRELTNH